MSFFISIILVILGIGNDGSWMSDKVKLNKLTYFVDTSDFVLLTSEEAWYATVLSLKPKMKE